MKESQQDGRLCMDAWKHVPKAELFFIPGF